MDDYFYDEFDPDYEDAYYTDTEVFTPRFEDVTSDCIWPSLTQSITYATKFIATNLVFRVLTQTIKLKPVFNHCISAACGCVLIAMMIDGGSIYLYGLILSSYLVFHVLQMMNHKRFGYIISSLVLIGLIVCEFFEPNKRLWHQLRGTVMIMVMKIISLAFDIDATKSKEFPGFMPYLGYLLCPSNVILGPWNSFNEYKIVFESPVWSLTYLLHIITNTCVSIVFLLSSNCIVYALIPDNTWKWIVAYRDALAFRSSHYFVSFLSQATMVAAGFTTPVSPQSFSNKLFGYEVSKPHKVEFPRSLVQVVVNWNIPMHNWLKQYVFRIIKPYSAFVAVLATYLISSLLHGINFQIAAVLLSLGFYTFIEYKLRQKLAIIYNLCTLANSCRSCDHEKQSMRWLALVINGIFAALTVFHLAYLGVMFEAAFNVQEEGYSIQNVLAKWSKLDYLSHWVMLFSYLFYLVI